MEEVNQTNVMHTQLCLQIDEVEEAISQFENTTNVACTDLDFAEFGDKYNTINSALGSITDNLFTIDTTQKGYESDWDRIEDLKFALDSIYKKKIFEFNKYFYNGIKTVSALEKDFKNAQFLQLATFSIVMSIIAFILTNAKILAAEAIDFRNVLLVNLSYILAVDFLFALVYLFIGHSDDASHSERKKLKFFLFLIFPIVLIVAIVLISLFM